MELIFSHGRCKVPPPRRGHLKLQGVIRWQCKDTMNNYISWRIGLYVREALVCSTIVSETLSRSLFICVLWTVETLSLYFQGTVKPHGYITHTCQVSLDLFCTCSTYCLFMEVLFYDTCILYFNINCMYIMHVKVKCFCMCVYLSCLSFRCI